MAKKKKQKNKTPQAAASADRVAEQLRGALRRIIHQFRTLQELPVDKLTALPQGEPRYVVRGAESYEDIQQRITEFLGLIWQLKDGLINWLATQPNLKIGVKDQYGNVTQGGGGKKANDTVEGMAKSSMPLLLCADVYNSYKHYVDCNRSRMEPFLSGVEFESPGGVMGIHYDGVSRLGGLTVAVDKPVPIRVEIWSKNHDINFGDAVKVGLQGFNVWLNLLRNTGLLKKNKPEDQYILKGLDQIDQYLATISPHNPGGQVVEMWKLSAADRQLYDQNPAEFVKQVKAKQRPQPV